jgi:hypothetical protein
MIFPTFKTPTTINQVNALPTDALYINSNQYQSKIPDIIIN